MTNSLSISKVLPESNKTLPPAAGVNFVGYLRTESGVGEAGRGYVKALKRVGIPASLVDISDLQTNRSDDASLEITDSGEDHGINIVCADVELHYAIMDRLGESFFRNNYNIGIWAWELPNFPDRWYSRLAFYDEIWVGSSFIANALSPISPVPVVCIPPVLTASESGNRQRGRRSLGAGKDETIFLFIFDFHSHAARKNPLAVVEAFEKAFSPGDPARLVIKYVNGTSDPGTVALLEEAAQRSNITLLDGYRPATEVRDLIAACDCYVSLHRSEGTGLTISEAMAHGKPVIATDWSGNTDFMNVANSLPVAYALTTVQENVGPYIRGETWAEPSVADAARLMRQIVKDPAGAQGLGRKARADIEQHFSEEAIGRLIEKRMQAVNLRHSYAAFREEKWSEYHDYRHLSFELRQCVERSLPPGGRIAVISKGDQGLLEFAEQQGVHFPQTVSGSYAGYYPATSAEAIEHLTLVKRRGATALLIPRTAFWWLEQYEEFARHLDSNYRNVCHDDAAIIYDLTLSPLLTAPERQEEMSLLSAMLSDLKRQHNRVSSMLRSSRELPAVALARPSTSGQSQRDRTNHASTARQTPYEELIDRLKRRVATALPRTSTIGVISRGDDRLLALPGFAAWHYPQNDAGVYAGHHPATSQEAIEHFEALREKGMTHFLVPAPSFWWLDFYSDLAAHLDLHWARLWDDSDSILFCLKHLATENGARA